MDTQEANRNTFQQFLEEGRNNDIILPNDDVEWHHFCYEMSEQTIKTRRYPDDVIALIKLAAKYRRHNELLKLVIHKGKMTGRSEKRREKTEVTWQKTSATTQSPEWMALETWLKNIGLLDKILQEIKETL